MNVDYIFFFFYNSTDCIHDLFPFLHIFTYNFRSYSPQSHTDSQNSFLITPYRPSIFRSSTSSSINDEKHSSSSKHTSSLKHSLNSSYHTKEFVYYQEKSSLPFFSSYRTVIFKILTKYFKIFIFIWNNIINEEILIIFVLLFCELFISILIKLL